jgi:hypothetical protein
MKAGVAKSLWEKGWWGKSWWGKRLVVKPQFVG